MKAKEIRNQDLYNFIVENYVESRSPMTMKQIAETTGYSLGYIQEFMYRHGLKKNKKELNDLVISLAELGFSQTYIARITGLSIPAINKKFKKFGLGKGKDNG